MEPLPPTPRKKDGRRERTAKAISAAASQLFFEQGVAGTTIDEIADAAGVSVGSVYVHYGSKEALYLTLVEEAAAMNARYVAQAGSSESPIERVFQAGDAYVRFALECPVQFRLISMQTDQPGSGAELEAVRRRITERVEQRLEAIGRDLADAVAAGEIDPVPVEPAAKYLWASWSAVIGLTLRTDHLGVSPEELHHVLGFARNVLARGLGRPMTAEGLFQNLGGETPPACAPAADA